MSTFILMISSGKITNQWWKHLALKNSVFSLQCLLFLPAQPARQGTGQPTNSRHLSVGTTQLENRKKSWKRAQGWLPPYSPLMKKPRRKGACRQCCCTPPPQAYLSGWAGVNLSEPRNYFPTKENLKEKGEEKAGVVVQLVEFPFGIGSVAQKTKQGWNNTPAIEEYLYRLPPQNCFTDEPLQKSSLLT